MDSGSPATWDQDSWLVASAFLSLFMSKYGMEVRISPFHCLLQHRFFFLWQLFQAHFLISPYPCESSRGYITSRLKIILQTHFAVCTASYLGYTQRHITKLDPILHPGWMAQYILFPWFRILTPRINFRVHYFVLATGAGMQTAGKRWEGEKGSIYLHIQKNK